MCKHGEAERTTVYSRKWMLVLLIISLFLSLFLRLYALDAYLTVDEPNWHTRSIGFLQALRQGDLAATYQSEHPGVMTMWAGVAGVYLSSLFDAPDAAAMDAEGHVFGMEELENGSGVPRLTVWARVVIAVVTWLAIGALFLLLRQAIDEGTAALATILVALDPFFLFHSRVHHLDGLLTAFCTLSVASLLVYRVRRKDGIGHANRYLVLSGAMAGLALASKTPAIVLIPCALLLILLTGLINRGSKPVRWGRIARHSVRDGVLWLAVFLIVFLAVWPATWVAPRETALRLWRGTASQALNPHENSNFFWFRKRDDPGAAFYPVAWGFRTTPLVMLGLVALFALHRDRWRIVSVTAGLFILLLGAALTISSKKLDRYLLPAFPLLDVLGGIGLWYLLGSIARMNRQRGRRLLRPDRIWGALVLLAVLGQIVLIAPTIPYYSAYFNPLLGGTRTAPKIMLIGWEEGTELATQYLNQKSNVEELHTSMQRFSDYLPFYRGKASLAGRAPRIEPDYFVLYASQVQRNFVPEVTGALYGVEEPEFVARVNGLEYAWVYANPFYRQEIVTLLNCAEERSDPSETILILPGPAAAQRYYEGPLLSVAIDGLVRRDYLLQELERGVGERRCVWLLSFPDVYVERAELLGTLLRERGELLDSYVLGDTTLQRYWLPETNALSPGEPETPVDYRLGENVRLIGYDLDETRLQRGETIHLRLYWRCSGSMETSYKVFTHLLAPDGSTHSQNDALPQGGQRPTTWWKEGDLIIDDYALSVAEDAPAGSYQIELGMYELETMQRLPMTDAEGQQMPQNRMVIEGLTLER